MKTKKSSRTAKNSKRKPTKIRPEVAVNSGAAEHRPYAIKIAAAVALSERLVKTEQMK